MGDARPLWSAICPSDAGVLAAALAPADSEESEFRGLRRLPRGYRSMRDRARTGDLALKPADDAEPASLRSRRRLGHGKHLQEASGRKLLRCFASRVQMHPDRTPLSWVSLVASRLGVWFK